MYMNGTPITNLYMYVEFLHKGLYHHCLSLQKADLGSVMDLPGPITVFAPSSSAFDAMTEGHLQYLSSAEVGTNQHSDSGRHRKKCSQI